MSSVPFLPRPEHKATFTIPRVFLGRFLRGPHKTTTTDTITLGPKRVEVETVTYLYRTEVTIRSNQPLSQTTINFFSNPALYQKG